MITITVKRRDETVEVFVENLIFSEKQKKFGRSHLSYVQSLFDNIYAQYRTRVSQRQFNYFNRTNINKSIRGPERIVITGTYYTRNINEGCVLNRTDTAYDHRSHKLPSG